MSEFFWFVVCIAIVIVGTNFETLQKLRDERKGNRRDRKFKINWIRNNWYNPYKKH